MINYHLISLPSHLNKLKTLILKICSAVNWSNISVKKDLSKFPNLFLKFPYNFPFKERCMDLHLNKLKSISPQMMSSLVEIFQMVIEMKM